MGVFDTFNTPEDKVPEAQVTYTGDQPYFDYQEGFVTDNEDDLQRRLGNRQIQYVILPPINLSSVRIDTPVSQQDKPMTTEVADASVER